MVHAPQVVVVDLGVAAGQRRGTARDPAQVFLLRRLLARRRGSVREPPEQHDAHGDGDDAVDEEHPLEADQAVGAVHLLEPGGHETDDGGRDLRGGVVLADAFAGPRGGIEQGEIVGHAGPHAGDDDAQDQTEETDSQRGTEWAGGTDIL